MSSTVPPLSFARILALNAGFFGVQYSFGLQQSNMSPIYNYLAPNTPTCRTCGWPGR